MMLIFADCCHAAAFAAAAAARQISLIRHFLHAVTRFTLADAILLR